MQKLQNQPLPSPLTSKPPATAVDRLPATQPSRLTKLLLVDFRSGESVQEHPEIAPLLEQGWAIRSMSPRLVESKGSRLLVVLDKAGRSSTLTRIK